MTTPPPESARRRFSDLEPRRARSGFTWYSLIDQVDWRLGLAEKRGEVNACGLYDLDRKPRPVAAAYRMLIENFGRISIMPHAEMLTLTTIRPF